MNTFAAIARTATARNGREVVEVACFPYRNLDFTGSPMSPWGLDNRRGSS
jgi:hypothetical protein